MRISKIIISNSVWLLLITSVLCAPDPLSTEHPADIVTGNYQTWKSSATEVEVVIVGGGVAGLTAAKTLIENNVTDIILLEADARVGGRVRTHREGEILTEDGAEWIHGGPANPLYRLAEELEKLSPNLPDSAWDFRVMNNKGQVENYTHFEVIETLIGQSFDKDILHQYRNSTYGQIFIDRFPEVYGEGWNSDLGKAWFHTLKKYMGTEMGSGNWEDVPTAEVSRSDMYGGGDVVDQWSNGYDELINYLMKSFPDNITRTSSPVCKIFWDEEDLHDGDEGGRRVLLVTNNGRTSYSAKHVIVTVSVGHLKERHQQLFQPPLPPALVRNINNVELAVSDKIQMGWSEPWWGTQQPLYLVLLWRNFTLPEEMEWLYGIVTVSSVHQQVSILQSFVVGDDAARMEDLPEEVVKRHFLHLLSSATGRHVPEPTFFRRTQWGRDPWRRGSYSTFITVEGDRAGLESHEMLAVPLINSNGRTVVQWAGEHTHNTRYSTVDGALGSGEREAKNLLDIMNNEDEGSRGHPADILTGNYQTWKSSAVKVDVVIVGGGVAGLTAAKTLLENNVTNILLLEADHRLGGRVRTYREGDILIEEGAEWIHGGKKNPLYRLAEDLGGLAPYEAYYTRESRVRTNDGRPVNRSALEMFEYLVWEEEEESDIESYYNTSVGHYLRDRFPEIYGKRWNSTMGRAWLHLMEMMVNYEMGTGDWREVSARDYDNFQDLGEDHNWKNGYDTLINYLKRSIPDDVIRTSSPVCKIFWDEEELEDDGEEEEERRRRVLLVTDNGRTSYWAKHVISTVSVGHLKERHQHLFEPPLPAAFVTDLSGIDLAVADKIHIGWTEPWWGSRDPVYFFILWTNRTLPPDMDWLYGITMAFTAHQHPCLLEMFVTGDSARRMEALPEDVVRQHIMHVLASSSGLQVPQPTFFRRTQWGQDPWKRGSYCSIITPAGNEGGLHTRQRFTVPLVNSKGNEVVLWAGEHTHNNRYSTVDGAMQTGEREAEHLLQIIQLE